MGIFISEWLKTKRTPMRMLTFFLPFLLPLPFLWYFSRREITLETHHLLFQAFFEVWTALVIPLGAGLLSGLLVHQEELAGRFGGFLINRYPRRDLYLGKLTLIVLLASVSTLLATAPRKVREKDLDFHIEYTANNEVGRLCQSFNEMKNELKKSLLAQWRAEQERQEMVQALAHDLKTPLSIIQGYAESLLDETPGDLRKMKKYLRIITDHARKGLKLIKEMLYASEMERPTANLRITPVDLSSFLMEKKESYEMIGKGKEIHFNVGVVYEKPDQAICPVDVEKLDRILDNIVGNSIRYTPEGGTITICAQVTHDHVQFTICDTGKGFSKKDLSNLFQKFYRGDESRSSKEGHAGLGLYVAKKMVEMHGGNITAFNAKEGGACIQFGLYFNRVRDE